MLSWGILENTKIFYVFNNSFPYSADVQPTVNKTGLILSTASTEHALSMCIQRSLWLQMVRTHLYVHFSKFVILLSNDFVLRFSKFSLKRFCVESCRAGWWWWWTSQSFSWRKSVCRYEQCVGLLFLTLFSMSNKSFLNAVEMKTTTKL